MAETIRNLQIGFGLIIAFVILGWCVWRLLIFFGLVTVRRAKVIPAYRPKENNRTDQPEKGAKGKQSMSTISRQALYSSRKHLD